MHRMTLRTGARDTKSVRTISLMERSCSKSARRISPILSTPIIPISPSQPTEAKGKDADTQRQRGSLLDAKIAPQGVIIASEFTVTVHLVLSGRTRGLIGAPEFALMKPTARFVNTSRGPIVDEA